MLSRAHRLACTSSSSSRSTSRLFIRRLVGSPVAVANSSHSCNAIKQQRQQPRKWCTQRLMSTALPSPSHAGKGTAISSSAEEFVSSNERKIAYWLLAMSGLVAGMVTVGGITRLTRSGLSMTDWRLQGSLPPTTQAEWEKEFDRYKLFPEWQQRKSMTLEEFKFIYFWEWGHRMLGRFIGVAFAVPASYFAVRGMIPASLYPRLGLLFGLGGTQGLIGWWMVKSGLSVDPSQKKEIRVSPYRLATHLSMAFTTYSLLLWTAMDLLNPLKKVQHVAALLPADVLKRALVLRRMAAGSWLLVATTVVSGAYVAGNDAGRAFNTFPMMGDEWVPSGIFEMQPLWRNFFENTALVQFDHRYLALSTLASVWATFAAARSGYLGVGFWSILPRSTRLALTGAAHMSVAQVGLGIATLLMYVPVPLAAVHQAGSIVLLTLVTALTHSLKFAGHKSHLAAARYIADAARKAPLTQLALTNLGKR